MKGTERGLLLSLLIGLSGAATLAGEVLGSRLLRLLLGSTSIAQAGTVAGVLGGLGLGAWIAGRALAHGRVDARRLLVVVHLALAAAVLIAVPATGRLATPVARLLVGLGEHHPVLAETARTLLGLVLTLGFGLLAGSVFPAAVSRLDRGAGVGTAWVGAISSFGSAAAALVATFVLAPSWGVAGTLRAVAAVYLLTALLAWFLARPVPAPVPVPAPAPAPPSSWPLLLALLLLGFSSSAWQQVLGRLGVLSFGPSAFALAAALAAHVSSLAVGELIAVRYVSRTRDARRALGRLVATAGLAAACTLPLLLRLPVAGELRFQGGAPPLLVLWATAYGLITLATLPVVGCVGAALAYGAQSLADERSLPHGEANGRMLLATGAGNVLGALLAPLALVPALRVEGALAAVALLLGASSYLLLRPRRTPALAWLSVVALVAGWSIAHADAGTLSSGPYLYAGSQEIDLGRVIWRRDGREGTVVVRHDHTGGVLLQINGKIDATSAGDATTQTVVGIVPTAMVRSPRDVLVVGLGSGMTVDAVRTVPGVGRILVAELLPEVVDAARQDFAAANHHVLQSPQVQVVEADAAHFLRGTSQRFDVIVSEPSNPWVAGMSDLFTREAFQAGRDRLRPGGVMGAWFHAYSTDGTTVASIVATFRAVFPRCALVEVQPGQDYLLVGFKDPYTLDVDLLLARISSPGPHAMLAAAGQDGPAAFTARFLAGPDGVSMIARRGQVLRADDLVLEFRAPMLLYRDAMAEVFALFTPLQDLPFAGLGAHGAAYLRLVDESESRREGALHIRDMVLADRAGALSRAITEGEIAITSAPGDPVLRSAVARMYLRRSLQRRRRRDAGGAESDLTSVLELDPFPAERFRALRALGNLALERRDGQRALARYEEALAMARAVGSPAPGLRLRLATALAMLGERTEAVRELDRALREGGDELSDAEVAQLRYLLQR